MFPSATFVHEAVAAILFAILPADRKALSPKQCRSPKYLRNADSVAGQFEVLSRLGVRASLPALLVVAVAVVVVAAAAAVALTAFTKSPASPAVARRIIFGCNHMQLLDLLSDRTIDATSTTRCSTQALRKRITTT